MVSSQDRQKTVGEVMHADVITCRPEATLRTVAGILATHRIHAVIVATGDEGAPCAVVTDRDGGLLLSRSLLLLQTGPRRERPLGRPLTASGVAPLSLQAPASEPELPPPPSVTASR